MEGRDMRAREASFSAASFAGNHERFHCFVWDGVSDPAADLSEWGVYHLAHRDSGLIEQSNTAAIRKVLAPWTGRAADGAEVEDQTFSHWAVGWVDALAVRVYRPGTCEPTEAFEKLRDLVESLADYPLLDESDHSRREYEATLENIEYVGRCCLGRGARVSADAPQGWAANVYTWLSD